MDETKTVHQCLFCSQTFDSASDKDDHILDHFAQETCTDCNRNLIRIGEYLYTRHNETTCIKKVPTSEEHGEVCTAVKSIPTVPEMDFTLYEEDTAATMSVDLDAYKSRISQIKTEQIYEDILDTYNSESTLNVTHENETNLSTSDNMLDIHNKFPNIDLNPVVVLEDVFGHKLHDLSTYCCQVCSVVFKRKKDLANHMQTEHSDHAATLELLNSTHDNNEERFLKCTYEGCEKRFKTPRARSLHLKAHSDDSYICLLNGCGKQFKFRSVLKLHQHRDHKVDKPIQKLQIKKKSKRQRDVQKQQKVVTVFDYNDIDSQAIENDVLSTSDSKQTYDFIKLEELSIESDPNLEELDALVTTDRSESEYHKCDDCAETFGCEDSKKLHILLFHSGPGFTCKICEKKYSQQRNLRSHLRRTHNLIAQSFKCKKCPFSSSRSDIVDHMDTVHLKKYKITCNKCGESFETRQLLKSHMELNHTENEQFKCSICLEEFNDHVQLTEHMHSLHQKEVDSNKQKSDEATETEFEIKMNEVSIESQSNDRDIQKAEGHKCDYCGEIFVWKSILESHVLRFHTGPEAFACEMCKKKFAQQRLLERHIQTVHGPKKYKCEICESSFAISYLLKQHVDVTHLNTAKCKCNICGMTFKSKRYLTSHVRIHTGERPYKCTYDGCDKCFRTRAAKVQHEFCHTNEKPYVCEIIGCEMAFRNAHSLRGHRKRKHRISTFKYSCEICGETFDMKTKLMKHTYKKHQTIEKNNEFLLQKQNLIQEEKE